MTTKTKLISGITLAAAIVAASIAMPEAVDARTYGIIHYYPNNGPAVPEVDPGTISSAIALAVGGMAVLRDKLRRR